MKITITLFIVLLFVTHFEPTHAGRAWESDKGWSTEERKVTPENTKPEEEIAGDYGQRYGTMMMRQLSKLGPCQVYSSLIARISNSSTPSQVRIMQIDKIIDKADKIGCVIY